MAYFPEFLSNLLEKLLPIIKLPSAIYAILFKLLSSVRAVFRQTVKQCGFTQNQLSHKTNRTASEYILSSHPENVNECSSNFIKCYKNFENFTSLHLLLPSLWHPLLRGPAAGMFSGSFSGHGDEDLKLWKAFLT